MSSTHGGTVVVAGAGVVELVVVEVDVVDVVVLVVVDVVVEVVDVVGAAVVVASTQRPDWQVPLLPPGVVHAPPDVAEVTQAPSRQSIC